MYKLLYTSYLTVVGLLWSFHLHLQVAVLFGNDSAVIVRVSEPEIQRELSKHVA